MRQSTRALLWAILALTIFAGPAQAQHAQGQLVYVPAYSQVYYGDKPHPFLLTTTLCVRNTDPRRALQLISVEYHGSHGQLLRAMLDKPMQIKPLSSAHFIVAESDTSGGVGACFLLRWQADGKINKPLIQAVMIGALSNQGISFICDGQPIDEAR